MRPTDEQLWAHGGEHTGRSRAGRAAVGTWWGRAGQGMSGRQAVMPTDEQLWASMGGRSGVGGAEHSWQLWEAGWDEAFTSGRHRSGSQADSCGHMGKAGQGRQLCTHDGAGRCRRQAVMPTSRQDYVDTWVRRVRAGRQ